jgi:phosphoglycolate phosphatase-like HAD superfamily hydrolase
MVYAKSLLIFDFDGVISNSLHDSYVTSLNSYIRSGTSPHFPQNSPLDPPSRIYEFENQHPLLFDAFRRLIPLGNRAEDYYVIWRILDYEDADSIVTQSDFDIFKRKLPATMMDAYGESFYNSRKQIQERDPEHWARLLPALDGIPEAIIQLSDRFTLAIATSKDLPSVHLLLKKYGVAQLFEAGFILDKDFSYSKRDHLKHFHQKFGIPYQAMYFIDDKVLHLLAVKDLGVNGYLALWGFNTQREREIAAQEGLRLLKLDELKELRTKDAAHYAGTNRPPKDSP